MISHSLAGHVPPGLVSPVGPRSAVHMELKPPEGGVGAVQTRDGEPIDVAFPFAMEPGRLEPLVGPWAGAISDHRAAVGRSAISPDVEEMASRPGLVVAYQPAKPETPLAFAICRPTERSPDVLQIAELDAVVPRDKRSAVTPLHARAALAMMSFILKDVSPRALLIVNGYARNKLPPDFLIAELGLSRVRSVSPPRTFFLGRVIVAQESLREEGL